VHKTTIFCVQGLVASGFIAVKALNCGFGWFSSEGWGFIVVVCFSFRSNPSQVNYHVTSRCSTAPALRACAGQFLSRGFMVLLRKSIP